MSLLLSFAQSPGLIVADTKLDLAVDPQGFLGRAAHLWSSLSPFGQVQNQAYGYFFPHGAFFVVLDSVGIPAWAAQRLWWALLLTAGFWGIIRVAEALDIGSQPSRIIAASAFALSPRVLTTIGAISSETTPMMLTPWALLPVILALNGRSRRPLWQLAAGSALAVACMGAINAVATAGGVAVALLWWLAHRPDRRWLAFTGWWVLFGLIATLWWVIPLFLMGLVSPPFLDYIESAATTTRWTSLVEVLRGTDSWTPFVSPDRVAGAALVTQPITVLATGALAAAGLAGLAMRGMPAKGRLVFILVAGLAGIGAGYAGDLGSPLADQVRTFLDGTGAPLRNVHKIEPLIRLPLVLGIAHLLARVPLPGGVPPREWQRAFARPERQPLVAVGTVTLAALVVATSVAWTGKLAPRGAYSEVPDYWHQAADWLTKHAGAEGGGEAATDRALVVPGSPFGSQRWGLTRDEPLQPLARTPWGVRDAIPLIPPGGIRAMDAVQRVLADGRSSPGLAPALLAQGYRYLVVRNDLDPDTARATTPLLVRQTLETSPGFEKVAEFGTPVGDEARASVVRGAGMRAPLPPVEIYRVTVGETWPQGPFTTDLSGIPIVQGGPEAIVRVNEDSGTNEPLPILVSADAANAGISVDGVIITDTPKARETDFGRVDHQRSGLLSAADPRRTTNRVPDYPAADPLVLAESGGGHVTVSSAVSDATQLGAVQPGRGPAAAVDGNPDTSWLSSTFQAAVGQWLHIDFEQPIENALLRVTTSREAVGPTVRILEVTTPNGSTSAVVQSPGESLTVALPAGTADWVRITARATDTGTAGDQFGISDVTVEANGRDVPLRRVATLPPLTTSANVSAWHLGQEFPGRRECVTGPSQVLCSPGLELVPEEAGAFVRRLSVGEPSSVRPELHVRAVPGPALDDLLTDDTAAYTRGLSSIRDPRGNAYAAADGDPETVWYAPLGSAPGNGTRPTVTLELPESRMVTAVRITPAPGPAPARPTEVRVGNGNGTVTAELRPQGDTTVELDPRETSSITITVSDWDEVRAPDLFGWSSVMPPGIAEITAIGADGDPIPAQSADPDRIIEIACGDGPLVQVGDTSAELAISARADDLRTGAAIPATLCEAEPLNLPTGTVDIETEVPAPFIVDRLTLHEAHENTNGASVADTGTPITAAPVNVRSWSDTHRVIVLDRADTDRLLTIPESDNNAWSAVTEDGRELPRIPVNGWQQGWVIPAGTAGEVTLTFAHDGIYRTALFGGLGLLVPLALLVLIRPRPRDHSVPVRVWQPRIAAPLAALVAVAVIAGPAGVAGALTLGGLALVVRRRWGASAAGQLLVAVAGTGMAGAAAVLSTGPWRAASGYLGHSGWVQLLALLAVAAVVIAALPCWRGESGGT
ncbi:alpha-(1-_3)-arabinofuranosyltransferase [Hoyosella sp. YIM 151337]|uniref:alpha-(1->3)-arabinofuranosyltransferase n=1 Tax=Hoyosella sp. YIM 151337 TaxID=2992742 RepID=UPI0022365C04|nr:alpha-(1->3)-arabinofuranosyltransferase [Hoyosella sp. YIM 151337]MCW4355833.1 alpha-(1->3)-arabinofuranosyltransferase [Hoyosella sp. YIM 151337]